MGYPTTNLALARPRSGTTTFHRDGTITYWSVHRQSWARTSRNSYDVQCSLSSKDALRAERHLA